MNTFLKCLDSFLNLYLNTCWKFVWPKLCLDFDTQKGRSIKLLNEDCKNCQVSIHGIHHLLGCVMICSEIWRCHKMIVENSMKTRSSKGFDWRNQLQQETHTFVQHFFPNHLRHKGTVLHPHAVRASQDSHQPCSSPSTDGVKKKYGLPGTVEEIERKYLEMISVNSKSAESAALNFVPLKCYHMLSHLVAAVGLSSAFQIPQPPLQHLWRDVCLAQSLLRFLLGDNAITIFVQPPGAWTRKAMIGKQCGPSGGPARSMVQPPSLRHKTT